MKDRVPGKAGRVLITPEDGSPAFYATLTRADEPTQAGDPLNKATLLADAVAEMYGLGGSALPSDVFGILGQYAQHQWFRKVIPSFELAIADTAENVVIYDQSSTAITSMYYYTTAELDPNHEVILSPLGPSVDFGYNATSAISRLYGNYIWVNGQPYYVPDGALVTKDNGGNGYRILLKIKSVYARNVSAPGPDTYLRSSDENAYPHSGESGGYEFTYLGRSLEHIAREPLRVISGRYYGTGEYGAEAPNRIEVPFKKVLALFVVSMAGSRPSLVYLGQPGSSSDAVFTAFEGGLEWYGSSAYYQTNEDDTWYYYLAFGIDTDREEN